MMVSLAAQFLLYLLSPLGSISLLVGDWLFTALVLSTIVENYVPNGPAIVGNVSAIFPVFFNILRSTLQPAFQINYTDLLQEALPALALDLSHWSDFLTNTTVPEE